MRFPKRKWSLPAQSPNGKAVEPEESIQGKLDEYLELRGIPYLRIPNAAYAWVKRFAPVWFAAWFMRLFAGLSDNVIFLRIAKDMELCIRIELKTQDAKGRAVGKAHGRQKHGIDSGAVHVCRSFNEAQALIEKMERVTKAIARNIECGQR